MKKVHHSKYLFLIGLVIMFAFMGCTNIEESTNAAVSSEELTEGEELTTKSVTDEETDPETDEVSYDTTEGASIIDVEDDVEITVSDDMGEGGL